MSSSGSDGQPAFERVDVTRDVPFATVRDVDGAEVRLTLDVYEPAGDTAPSRPAIVWIHGGGFRPGMDKKQGYIVTLATAFAKRGYVSIAPDYRVRSAPDRDRPGTIRDAVADTRAALGWLREKSATLDGSPVTITGEGRPACAMTMEPRGGEFFGGFPEGCSVTANDVVYFTDRATTIQHTVRNLAITKIDKDADTVSGVADTGAYIMSGYGIRTINTST